MVLADVVQDKASAAVATTILDFDACDFTVYTVRDDGFPGHHLRSQHSRRSP
jgi:hypothetical protein